MSKFEIIIKENNKLIINEQIDEILTSYIKQKETIEEQDKNFRKTILDPMISNNVLTGETKKFKLTQVVPKDTVIFDNDNFILNEPEDIVTDFVRMEVKETFDLEALKTEAPEIYEKYLKREEVLIVEDKRVEKVMPTVYKKYTKTIPSTKEISLRITEKK